MPANFNLRDALRTQQSEDAAPLLTDSEILDAIRSSQLNTNQQSNNAGRKRTMSSRRTYQWTLGVVMASVISLLIYSVLTPDSVSQKSLAVSNQQHLTSEHASNNENGVSPVTPSTSNNESMLSGTDSESSSKDSSEMFLLTP